MKHLRVIPIAIVILLAACQPPLPPAAPATATTILQMPSETATLIPPTETQLPPPTETATAAPVPSIQLPMSWPMSPFTEAQVSEARSCDIEGLASQRYSSSLEVSQLASAYAVETACDWAVLAFACAQKSPQDSGPSEPCLFALNETVALNPALLLRNQIFQYYLGTTSIVQAPPIAQKQLVKLFVRYEWTGLGDRVRFTITVSRLTGNAVVNVDPNSPITPATDEIKNLSNALPAALTDLVPIGAPMTVQFCTDNYPAWEAILTFDDDSELELTTNESNLLTMGGPWQTVIDGQQYVQFSGAFARALNDLVQALGLKYGEPAGMYCGANMDILDLAFPQP